MRIPAGAPVVTAQAMRDAEAALFDTGTSQEALMKAAGRAVADQVLRFALGRPVLVLAGPGNNGGDGYAVARLLAERGLDVTVATLGPPAAGAAATMASRWTGSCCRLADAPERPVVVDALFGIGTVRPLDEPVRAKLAAIRLAAQTIVAIDLPSGLDADGVDVQSPPLPADITVALGALKPAHVVGDHAAACGAVLLEPIGIAARPLATTLARPTIMPPPGDAHKYTRGLVIIIGGAMPGAARLAANAALHGGAGYVVESGGGGSASGGPAAIVHRDEPVADLLDDPRIAAAVVGPGLGRDEGARRILDDALASPAPLVVDGDALSLLGESGVARIAARTAPVVLTPHAGEFATMFGVGAGNKIDRTIAAARRANATVVHKGSTTVIAHADGRVVVWPGASSWLSTAGTGDVLAGLIAARVASAGDDAAAQAVWLHARAAALAGPAFAADDLIQHLSAAIGECR